MQIIQLVVYGNNTFIYYFINYKFYILYIVLFLFYILGFYWITFKGLQIKFPNIKVE